MTIDVSFISLRLILPVVPPLLADGGDVVALVKPQFEAGRAEVGKGGIVRDPAVQARVLEEVAASADALGLGRAGSHRISDCGNGRQSGIPAPSSPSADDPLMPITRVGLVAKTGLDAAAGALAELAGWLEARDVHAVFETETAASPGCRRADAPSTATNCRGRAI